MISHNQWSELNAYITERIKKEAEFTLSDHDLFTMFGITHPFWNEMCAFANIQERAYTMDEHWYDTTWSQEPTAFIYKRREPGSS